MTQTIDQTLAERGSRYGEFTGHAEVTQNIKQAMKDSNNWDVLDDDQVECLEMVAHKIGRILNGDPDYIDSWTDIIGYTRLVEKRLTDEQAKPKDPQNTVSGIEEFLARLAEQVNKTEEKCNDPSCVAHNPEIANALKVLVDAGILKQVDGDS